MIALVGGLAEMVDWTENRPDWIAADQVGPVSSTHLSAAGRQAEECELKHSVVWLGYE